MPTLSRDFLKAALSAAEGPDGSPLVRHLEWAAACDSFASVKMHIPGTTDADTLDTFARRVHGAIRAAAGEQGVVLSSLTVELVDEAGAVLLGSNSGPKPTDEQTAAIRASANVLSVAVG